MPVPAVMKEPGHLLVSPQAFGPHQATGSDIRPCWIQGGLNLTEVTLPPCMAACLLSRFQVVVLGLLGGCRVLHLHGRPVHPPPWRTALAWQAAAAGSGRVVGITVTRDLCLPVPSGTGRCS